MHSPTHAHTPTYRPAFTPTYSRSDRDNWRNKQPRPPYIRERISYGIACIKITPTSQPQILMVRKRFTYAYNLFVNGRYNSSDRDEQRRLLCGMTVDEKHDILSLNFVQMWYRIWLNAEKKTSTFFTAKTKYESTFARDGGKLLRRLMAGATHTDRLWEIPKGRKQNKYEADIHTAVREFCEETGIEKEKYKLIPDASRSFSYIDDGTKYTNIFYLAQTCGAFPIGIDFRNQEQINEISDIRWMNIEDIRRHDDSGRLEAFVRPIFRYLSKQQ